MTVRVRIAPSPTGFLHVGNARSALFNWLFARHEGGTFVVRIDDTDRERSEPEYEEDILSGLRWLGLDWDEGPGIGGPHGTYRQSDRFGRYREVAEGLVARGFAYYDDRSPDELDRLRSRAQSEGKHPNVYIRRPDPERASGVIRFSVPQDAAVTFLDLVRGDMRFGPEVIDDFVILRSDGSPTYHLASTVDDIDYEISHVIRGEDLLSSTPKHLLLTRSLGAAEATYAHLPLLFGPDGKKLSKRHGDTSVRAYRTQGYLPEAMFNYMSLLGWSFDPDVTIFSRNEAVARFDLSDVSKNPAVFDTDKLLWMNGEYVRSLEPEDFLERTRASVEHHLERELTEAEWYRYRELGPLVQERTKLLPEAGPMTEFLFTDTVEYDEKSWSKVMKPEAARPVSAAMTRLESLGTWEASDIEASMRAMLEDLGLNPRKGLQPLRVAVTGSQVSPPLFESMAALDRGVVLARLDTALAKLEAQDDSTEPGDA